jgi:monofunctional biosynthetic peptidoglycan transglycosylase
VVFHAALFLLVAAACLFLSRANPPVTALMVYRATTVHQRARPIQFVPLRQVPRTAREMFVRVEDFKFYRHAGIDLAAIRDAYLINRQLGYNLYGGSTIPQQLARTLFLTPRKTFLRKYVEALIALEMDLLLTKSRILELYLNYIEWGKGVYGIGSASAFYFKTRPAGLTLDEQRRLVTILPNPLRYNVNTFLKSHQMAERYRYLVSRFPDEGTPGGPEGMPGGAPGGAAGWGAGAAGWGAGAARAVPDVPPAEASAGEAFTAAPPPAPPEAEPAPAAGPGAAEPPAPPPDAEPATELALPAP